MLDSLLYEPKRRRIAIAVLFSLLVLAVGFVAFGTLFEGLGILTVFGVAFVAAAIFSLAKLLLVSHVHIRGSAGRLDALNRRYDETARWLERYDADTRESFLATKAKLEQAESDRLELMNEIEKIDKQTPRLTDFEQAKHDLSGGLDKLEAQGQEHKASIEKLAASSTETHEQLRSDLDGLGKELGELAALSGQIADLRAELTSASDAEHERSKQAQQAAAKKLDEVQSELETKVRRLTKRVNQFNEEQDQKRQQTAENARKNATTILDKVKKRVDDTSRLSARHRGDGYVQFPRLVSNDVIEASETFGGKLSVAEARYLERKLQVLEGLCEGRLAGSVDDAVGRMLAGRMVKGKELRILEIGVLFGVGAAFLHHALTPRFDRVRLVLLDPFQGYYGSDHLDPLTGLPVTRASVERNLARCGINADDVEIIEGFSNEDPIREAAEKAGPYHVIVIDGDHTAQGIKTDFEGYASMLRSGGMLVIDDYGSEDWPDVTAFVDEVVREDPRFKLVAVVGKTAVFKRQRVSSKKTPAKTTTQTTTKSTTKATPKKASKASSKSASRSTSKASDSVDADAPPASAPAGPESDTATQDPPIAEIPPKKKRTRKASPKKAAAVAGDADAPGA